VELFHFLAILVLSASSYAGKSGSPSAARLWGLLNLFYTTTSASVQAPALAPLQIGIGAPVSGPVYHKTVSDSSFGSSSFGVGILNGLIDLLVMTSFGS
jgi:hypothetical protein